MDGATYVDMQGLYANALKIEYSSEDFETIRTPIRDCPYPKSLLEIAP
jgi:hypothetical protein